MLGLLCASLAVALTGCGTRAACFNRSSAAVNGCLCAWRRGMSATAGLTATAGEGQKLWTTLLLGLSDILLCINIWGHARDQQKLGAAKADSRAVRKQVRLGAPRRRRLSLARWTQFGTVMVPAAVGLCARGLGMSLQTLVPREVHCVPPVVWRVLVSSCWWPPSGRLVVEMRPRQTCGLGALLVGGSLMGPSSM